MHLLKFPQVVVVSLTLVWFTAVQPVDAFVQPSSSSSFSVARTGAGASSTALSLLGNNNNNARLSDLPQGISPFEKSKGLDIGGDFRRRALQSLQRALRDGIPLMEIEFPPNLLTGKSSFDDFDNIQELDLNRDWCVELLPQIDQQENVWFLLPDRKECQLAKEVWTGSKYRSAAVFTTIEQVTKYHSEQAAAASNDNDDDKNSSGYAKPWGATFADAFGGIMGDNTDTQLQRRSGAGGKLLHLVCQPGNGGPVEDWINCERLHTTANNNNNNNAAEAEAASTLVVNGALDKVRDGYYPAFFFPQLAATVDRFYRKFESIFYLKPIADKGVYGWLYRSYPEVRAVYCVLLPCATQNGTSFCLFSFSGSNSRGK